MICPYCGENHETWNERIKGAYNGVEVEFTGAFIKCSKNGRTFADASSNDIALKDAYKKKKGLLTSRMVEEIRMRYRREDLRAILGREEEKIFTFGGHYVQSKEYDVALRTLDQMLQLSMHQ